MDPPDRVADTPGESQPRQASAVVLGAGLTGLSAAWHLAGTGIAVTLLEAGAAPGGVARSLRQGAYLVETGPNTVPASSTLLRRLAGEVGLGERLVAADPSARRRYLWVGGRLRALPGSLLSLASTPLLGPGTKLRLLTEPLRPWRAPAPGSPEPSLGELLDERLGSEVSDRFAGAFVRGIYAGDHRRLGARSAFPRLWESLERHGGLVRGLFARSSRLKEDLPGPRVPASRLLSFPEGLGELAGGLAASLGPRLRLGESAVSLERAAGGWCVRTSAGGELRAERVVLALPAPESARLLASAGQADAAERLRALPLGGVRAVHLGFPPGTLTLPPGFGFLVPPSEGGLEALGMLFPSNLFAGRAAPGGALVTAFYPADWAQGTSPAERAQHAARELGQALGLARTPAAEFELALDWPTAIPQYEVGHAERIADLEAHLAARAPGLYLAGSYTAGVAVEQVLTRGREVAARIALDTSFPAVRP